MKALSVRAPWWWAILHGKPVENRDWPTSFRGRFYLHASKFWKRDDIACDWEDVEYMAEEDDINIPTPDWQIMRGFGGYIVGSVEIVDCVTEHPSAFFVGKFGFVLRNPIIKSSLFPVKGALGFFDVPDNTPGL